MTSSSRRKRRITESSETSPDPRSGIRRFSRGFFNHDPPAILSFVLHPYDPRPGRCSGPSLCPFDRDDCASVGQLIETQPFDLRWFQSIQIDVLQGHRPSIFLNQGKGRARHVVGRCAESLSPARGRTPSSPRPDRHAGARRLPLQSSGKPFACDDGLVFAASGDGF